MTRGDRGAARFLTQERALLYGVAIFLIYVGVLAFAWWQRIWFIQPDGKPLAVDFLNFWSAGFVARTDHAEQLYDIARYKGVEVGLIGHDFGGYYPWPYPPTLLLLVAPLSRLPYLAAWFIWAIGGVAFLVAALRCILPLRLALPLAIAAPATLWCMAVGQNGFLTAGLMACALTLLERRPWLAGICFALLTYKPQFGLAIPLFLIANRNARAILVTVAALAGLIRLSALTFGIDAWRAFFASITNEGATTLFERADWSKLQSLYAILAQLLGDARLALIGHIAIAAVLLAPLLWLWTRRDNVELKYAALVSADFLFSPHAYIYDAVLLTVGVAYLVKDGLARGFLPWDQPLLFLAWASPALFGLLDSFTAPLEAALILGLSFRRAAAGGRNAVPGELNQASTSEPRLQTSPERRLGHAPFQAPAMRNARARPSRNGP